MYLILSDPRMLSLILSILYLLPYALLCFHLRQSVSLFVKQDGVLSFGDCEKNRDAE